MGQQQILFVILVVCIIGVSVSVGVLSLTANPLSANREVVQQDLLTMAHNAQEFVSHHPGQAEDNEISFSRLSRMPDVLDRLGCTGSNAHGDFFVKKSHNPASLQIIGVGIAPGYDGCHPLRMMMTVWADRTSLVVLN